MTLFLLASRPGLSRPSTSYLPPSKAWMPGTRPGMTGNLSERRLGLADDRLERRRFGDGEVGKHFAVDRDAGLAQAGDEAAVVQPERAHRGVEALNPQRAEGALLALAVAEGVLARLLHRLLGDADGVLAPAVIALGGLEHLLVLGMGCDAALDACHGRSPLKFAERCNGMPAASWQKSCRPSNRQPFGKKYFLMLSPSVLNSTLVPRNWRICFLVRLIMPWRLRDCA